MDQERLDLIARLEQADSGNREIDGYVALGAGWTVVKTVRKPDITGQAWGCWKWTGPGEYGLNLLVPDHGNVFEVAYHVPRFSTSLDAALPWESIRHTMMLADGRWEASALDSNGDYQTAEAATEPLARRIAALKAKDPTL